jgi:chaperonin GroES
VQKNKIIVKTKKYKTMAKLSIKPVAGTQNRVIVEPAKAEEKTAGGIIIPDTAKEKPQKGKIVAVSEHDEKGNKPVVKVGDNVLYGKYAGTEITVDGKDLLIMRESDIFAIV